MFKTVFLLRWDRSHVSSEKNNGTGHISSGLVLGNLVQCPFWGEVAPSVFNELNGCLKEVVRNLKELSGV